MRDQEPGRTRVGLKHSRPEHNAEGETEGKLKQLRDIDRVWTCKLKKRHRKDLSIEEIEEILEAAKQPYRLHKDIA